MPDEFDLIVVGGGPAGSTLATLVAKDGHRVLLLERDRFPRYQVGESLLPATIHGICPLLGVEDEIRRAGFPVKLGGTFRWGNDDKFWSLYFGNCVAGEDDVSADRSHAYQVRRSDFDAILLKNAAENGVEVREGHTVLDLLSENERITGVRFRDEAGREQTATARFVADASGHQSCVAARLGERIASKFYRNIGLYGYFEHGGRLPGKDAGNTLFEAFEGGWLWYIPLSDTLTSVGAVITQQRAPALKRDLEAALRSFIDACPVTRDFLAGARRCEREPYAGLRVRKEFSYCHTRFWAPGAVLVGDSACFIDVLLSSGVHLATYSALLAARSINTCLAGELDEDRCFDEFEMRYRLEFSRFYQLLVGLYDMKKDGETYHTWLRTWLRQTNGTFLEPAELQARNQVQPMAGLAALLTGLDLPISTKISLKKFRDFNRRILETDGSHLTMDAVAPLPGAAWELKPDAGGLRWVECHPAAIAAAAR
jgi:halogenation protein CepH